MKAYRTREQAVTEFHKAMNAPIGLPLNSAPELIQLRMELLEEECNELLDVLDDIRDSLMQGLEPLPSDVENLYKEMADVQYVLSGLAVSFGIPLQTAFNRVHESNMSKLHDDGTPRYRADGKVLKGANYKEPVMSDLVIKDTE